MSNQSHLEPSFPSPTVASSDGVNVVGCWPQIPRDHEGTHPPPLKKLRYSYDTPPNPQQNCPFFPPSNHPHNLLPVNVNPPPSNHPQIPRDHEGTHPPPLKKLRYSDDTPPNPQQICPFFPPSHHPHNLLPVNVNPPHGNKTTIFFKTRLCNKFKQGTCFYGSQCNFAHGDQELRSAPPNWQEIMARHHSSGTWSEQQKHTMGYSVDGDNYNFDHRHDELKKFGGNAVSRNADGGAGPARLHSNPAEERAPPSKPEPIARPQPEQQKAFTSWKVPTKIAGIYGDWIN